MSRIFFSDMKRLLAAVIRRLVFCVGRNSCSARKWLISSSVLMACLMIVYWTSSPTNYTFQSHHANNFIMAHFSISREPHKPSTKSEDETSTEVDLLRAVNNLPLKAMTVKSGLLEDAYFIPSAYKYIMYNYSSMHEPRESCSGSEYLFILVPSRPNSFRERQVIRETWGSVARGNIWPGKGSKYHLKLLFVLGLSADPSTELWDMSLEHKSVSHVADNIRQVTHSSSVTNTSASVFPEESSSQTLYSKMLNRPSDHETNGSTSILYNSDSYRQDYHRELPKIYSSFAHYLNVTTESKFFDDILIINMIDSYANLTIKIISALQWLVKTCKNVKYILKVDQDIFIHIPLLMTFLNHYGKANTVYGAIVENAEIQREGKWAVSNKSIPISVYPIYAAGNAYVMSRDSIEKILKVAPHFRYVPIEDAFITGILASVVGVNRVHVDGFTKWEDDIPHACEFVNDRRYAGNKFTEDQHRNMWKTLQNNGNGRCDMCRWSPWVVEADMVYTNC